MPDYWLLCTKINLMKALLLSLSLVGLLAACQSDAPTGSALIEEIKALETTAATNPAAATNAELVENYLAYVAAHPEDTETNGKYLYKAGSTQYRMNRFSAALETLQRAIKNYYPSNSTPSSILLMGDIYQNKLQNPTVAAGVYGAFVKAFPNHPRTAELTAEYGNAPDIPTRIVGLSDQLYNDSLKRVDYRVANHLIALGETQAMVLPADPQSPEMLYKAGQIANSIRASEQSIALNEWLYERYPDHPRAGRALFLMAFTYDNELKDFDKAGQLYRQFLAEYPEDDFAQSARFQLDNLGKSANEIIEGFDRAATPEGE